MRVSLTRAFARAAAVGLVLLTAAVVHAQERFALIIGANPGWADDRPLSYAETDAVQMRDVLVSLGGFAPDRVELMTDPDTAAVRAWFGQMAGTAKKFRDDVWVFVYYSGHADDRHLHLRGTPLGHEELATALRELPAAVRIGVVDACKSGRAALKGGAPAAEFEVALNRGDSRLRGFVMLTSSGADELSQESRALAGSVFSHHWISGLRGAADQDSDGEVTLAEAYAYAYRHTRVDTSASIAPQRPSFRFDLRGAGEIVLTRVSGRAAARAATLRVPAGPARNYVVVDEREWRLLGELRADDGRAAQLSIEPGRYRVKQVLSDRVRVAVVAVRAGQELDLTAIAYRDEPLAMGVLRGRPQNLLPDERRTWRTQRGFHLLATGQPKFALAVFNEVLVTRPDDLQALRGRARALVQLAEDYRQLGREADELSSLRQALDVDPSLDGDPVFHARYAELDGRERAALSKDRDTRQDRSWGAAFELASSRGYLVMVVSAVLGDRWFANLSVDLAGPGLGVDFGVAPLARRWSPYVGIGAHITAAGIGLYEEPEPPEPMPGASTSPYGYHEMFGKNLHVEVGAQYVGPSGFSTLLGLAGLLFETYDGEVEDTIAPILNLGWVW